ncbi:MAG TPA: TetR/AcrR family transcriptional regulator [Roseiarcus sp.]|jgi:TetR/AcrR family transcriptional repressor of mexJK operon|nr:TetR/AcrR family transcriptional regulator [Roseiarcus sp.]
MSEGQAAEAALEKGAFRRGPGGRPTRKEAERRHRELLETTKRLLLERGWEATSIDEISRQSGVAKRFLYARYPDKAALFAAAVAQFRDEQIGALGAFDAPPDDVEEGLLALGRRMMDLALRDETLAIIRLFLAEAPRMRDYAKLFAESFPRRGLAGISHFLTLYAERGALTLDDAELAAQHFAMLIIGVPQRLAMLGHRDRPEAEERRLRSAVKLFLDGCRRKSR